MVEDYAALASFAVGEMGLRLHDFYEMPLNELLIGLNAWDNKREREILDNKYLAYHMIIAPRLQKIPSFEEFIGNKQKTAKRASEKQRELMLAAVAEYNNKVGDKDEFRSGDTSRHR